MKDFLRTYNSVEDYQKAGCTELEIEAAKCPASQLSKEGALLAFGAMDKLRDMYRQEREAAKNEKKSDGNATVEKSTIQS